MLKIGFENLPSFNQEVVLDGNSYVLNFNWNSRGGYWTIDFLGQLRNPLVMGIKIVIDYGLIGQFVGYGLPEGELYAIDLSGDTNKIQQYDFVNNRVGMYYITKSELESV